MISKSFGKALGVVLLGGFVAVALAGLGPAPAEAADGAVYVMTNARSDNRIVIYDRAANGMLTMRGSVSTGGRGSGGTIDPLASQGSLVLSEDQQWLYAVNAGSGQISVLEVTGDGLELVQVLRSRGTFPVSLSAVGNRLYVLNAMGRTHVQGFRIREDGTLKRLVRSRRLVTSEVTADGRPLHPAQVQISPLGDWLVVDDVATSEIHVWALDGRGRPSVEATVNPSAGGGPFGFTFSRKKYLVVGELFGVMPPGTAGAGAVSSYSIADDGTLEPISASVQNRQSGVCWMVSDGGRFVYTTNTNSGTMTAYRVRKNGRLNQLAGNGISFRFPRPPNALPIDVASADGFIYTLNTGTGTVGIFSRSRGSGQLTFLGEAGGLPPLAGLQGIAAR